MAAISYDSAHQLEPLNAKIQFGERQANAMIDFGSVVSLITKTLANRILRTSPSAKWIAEKEWREIKASSNEPIKVLGHFETTVTFSNWTCKDARLTIVEDGYKIIVWRDLFNSLCLAIVQQQQTENGICFNNINNSTCKIKGTIAAQFPHLVSRIGLSKTHVAKSKFHQKFTAKHQKSRRFPTNPQPRVTAESERLENEGHIKKLSSCSDKHFISPIVISVKKINQSIWH